MKSLIKLTLAATSALAVVGGAAPAFAQAEPILGQVSLFATNWCPKGWAQASGTTLPIAQYTALFSLYGTTYGGNGTTTFALPNLNDRAPIGWSSTNPIGAVIGQSSVTLTIQQMPQHNHMLLASSQAPASNSPTGASLATFPSGNNIYAAATATPDVQMNAGVIGFSGGNLPVPTQSPSLALNYCVAMQGIFPSRN